ncbi:unnamed protein product [Auanema sp. JU1783]|nr:unnamed protein product [Auanema sp. JU1783]
MINLLENEYSTFRIGESIENLCMSCGPSSKRSMQTEEVVLMLDLYEGLAINSAIRILFENGYKSFVVAKSIESACSNCRGTPSVVEVPTLGESSDDISTHSPVNNNPHTASACTVKDDPDETTIEENISPYSLILSSLLNQTNPEPKSPEEQSDENNLTVSESLDNSSGILEQFMSLRRTLFTEKNTSKPKTKPRKRQCTQKSGEKCDVHECQICGTKVTFGSDVRNFLKCADRHARLHATKKQYSCTECSVGFTRIDVVKQHISSVHKGSDVRFIDHGYELREEYLALSERCFPEIEAIRKSLKKVSS